MSSRWITCPRANPTARMRLFCFPFGGGGASTFGKWPTILPTTVEVCPVQLPGREERYGEPAYTDLVQLARVIVPEIQPYLDKPFAFYGHSMGALIAFEVARALRESGLPQPEILFVAAYQSPDAPMQRKGLSCLPDQEFIAELRRLEGTPEEALNNLELMDFLMPTMRADFEG